MAEQYRHIHVLSDNVVNKIAAGEVVERPASALKELIENALDAGATQVDVDIVSGGRTLIRVSDNGTGMDRNDALLSIERHATSKIRDVNDIEGIDTLGFRGEALAAVSAVSRFRLRTRRHSDLAGTEISVSGGKIQDVRETGCPPGTAVEVRNLFFNVPARRKFLRSEQTELFHIRQVFVVCALAHLNVGIKLTIDGRKIYSLPGKSLLEDRLRDMFPSTSSPGLKSVNYTLNNIAVSGYISFPDNTRADRAEQYFFVNRRPARAALLSRAVRDGYHSMIARDRHPIIFLFIRLNSSLVDVNIHPTKKEVKFRNPGEVHDILAKAIRDALGTAEAKKIAHRGLSRFPSAGPQSGYIPGSLKGMESSSHVRKFSYPRQPAVPDVQPERAASQEEKKASEGVEKKVAAGETPSASPWAWYRILGQVGGLYIVIETEDGLVLMDPHAAHERVLYEQLLAEVINGEIKSQQLLIAETVDMTLKDAMVVRQYLDLLKKMGFGIAEFGGDTFVIDAFPACLGQVSCRNLLEDITVALEESGDKTGTGHLLEMTIARAACRSAVKAGKQLTPEEIEQLVDQLARAEMPYTCPHGRPTLIHTSFQELNKRFGRK